MIGIIDKRGKEIIPCKYDDIDDVAFEYSRPVIVVFNGKFGYVMNGKEILPCRYDDVYSLDSGYLAVLMNSKWGLVDMKGKEVIPCKYDHVHSFDGKLALVTLNGENFYVDKTGRTVGPKWKG